jgi:hypothetical protein
MANGHGGPRTPNSPAPVSGPGALSKRTDGPQGGGRQPIRVPTGGQYGDAQQLQQLQQGAPLAQSGGGQSQPGLLAGLQLPQGASLADPSAEPGTPVTAGAALGAGPGLEALGLPQQQDEDLRQLLKNLPVFEHMANVPGSSKAARNLVRQLKGLL